MQTELIGPLEPELEEASSKVVCNDSRRSTPRTLSAVWAGVSKSLNHTATKVERGVGVGVGSERGEYSWMDQGGVWALEADEGARENEDR